MSLDTSQKVGFVAGAAAVLPFAIAAIGLYEMQRLSSDSTWVSHSQDVRLKIEAVGRHIDGAKGDVRVSCSPVTRHTWLATSRT